MAQKDNLSRFGAVCQELEQIGQRAGSVVAADDQHSHIREPFLGGC